ncbi:MAG TPA: sensor histidine kinase [Candidatus Acidoferrum sp.]|nr:sensor histidine kinase [Candidatus Acidoferrum sp.]
MPHSRVVERYTIACTMAVVAVLTRELLDPVLGHVAFYVTVYIAVAFSAIVCGFAPAVLSALVGFLGIFYWFVDPRHSFAVDRPSEIHGIVGFSLVCGVLIMLGAANGRKQVRLNRSISELTTEAAHRREAEARLEEAHEQLERRVEQRTGELTEALAMLQSEMEIREEAEGQFRDLSVRLMTLQDDERRRIARDLHDSTGQTLSALKMAVASLQHSVNGTVGISRLMDDVNALADEALREIRTTSYLLHPPLLDEAGFASAARWFVDGFSKRSNIKIECDIPQRSERLSKECELVLFRVLQESLTNVHRHSGASSASVTLTMDQRRLELQVSDNGSGIAKTTLAQVDEPGRQLGVGIAGMRERVRKLGGRLDLQSSKAGTKLSVSLPMVSVIAPQIGAPAGMRDDLGNL